MTDELNIPQVPEAKSEDPEDVSWALSTAEAMWARGDHAEGIKWVRRAAEAASEAENDGRALELAKAAADLQALLARRTLADKGSERSLPAAPKANANPSVTARIAAPSGPISAVPPTNRSVPPVGRSSGAPSSRSVPSITPKAPTASGGAKNRSIPPIPLPSKSSPPTAAAASSPPASGNRASKAPPRPVGTTASKPPEEKKKGRGRKSRENLEAEARAAGVLQVSPDTDEVIALDDEEAIPLQSKPPPKPFDSDRDATIITSRTDLENQKKKSTRGPDWDASPTQNTVGNIAEEPEERKTRVGAPPISAGHPSAITQAAPRSSQAPQAPARENPRPRASPSIIPHDDSIQTCQAVRVVVWRDAQGVHVAPAGTVVSAIKIDAVLVALEPTADLTAWLSRKDR